MRRNGYLGASGQKSDPPIAPATSISYKTDRCISTTEWRLLDIFDVFCATTSHDLV